LIGAGSARLPLSTRLASTRRRLSGVTGARLPTTCVACLLALLLRTARLAGFTATSDLTALCIPTVGSITTVGPGRRTRLATGACLAARLGPAGARLPVLGDAVGRSFGCSTPLRSRPYAAVARRAAWLAAWLAIRRGTRRPTLGLSIAVGLRLILRVRRPPRGLLFRVGPFTGLLGIGLLAAARLGWIGLLPRLTARLPVGLLTAAMLEDLLHRLAIGGAIRRHPLASSSLATLVFRTLATLPLLTTAASG